METAQGTKPCTLHRVWLHGNKNNSFKHKNFNIFNIFYFAIILISRASKRLLLNLCVYLCVYATHVGVSKETRTESTGSPATRVQAAERYHVDADIRT